MTSALGLTATSRRRPSLPQLAKARLVGLGVATPELRLSQAECARRLAGIWRLRGGGLQRWNRMIRGSMIERRHAVLPPEEVVALTTGQRMELFNRFAPSLAAAAAHQALQQSQIGPRSITDLIVVTCTGFSAPGLDVELVERLGLSRSVHRSIIGFMGCFGGLIGLRAAAGTCEARPHSAALLVCAELCSLHIRNQNDPQNMVASALFADGAAAAIVVGDGFAADESRDSRCNDHAEPIAMISAGRSMLLPEGRRWMSWRITDSGFAMTLARQIPEALRTSISAVIDPSGVLAESDRPRSFIVHPGGSAILDAVEAGLDLESDQLSSARAVLRDFGNMSSGTVLFVLDTARRDGLDLPATMIAFGPGLSIETIDLRPSLISRREL